MIRQCHTCTVNFILVSTFIHLLALNVNLLQLQNLHTSLCSHYTFHVQYRDILLLYCIPAPCDTFPKPRVYELLLITYLPTGCLLRRIMRCRFEICLETSSAEEVWTPRWSQWLRTECAFSTSVVPRARAEYPEKMDGFNKYQSIQITV